MKKNFFFHPSLSTPRENFVKKEKRREGKDLDEIC